MQNDTFIIADLLQKTIEVREFICTTTSLGETDVIIYHRFFQHAVKHLDDNKIWDAINLTFVVSSAMYVATNIME